MSEQVNEQRVQIRDVAKHAGVSVGTVSNVLNERDFVAAELVERVKHSVQVLGFVPNGSARQLKVGANQTLGMLVLSSYNSFFNALADAAEDEADSRGHTLVLAASAQRSDRERKYLEMFERQRVGGVLLAPMAGVTPSVAALQSRGTPVILLGEADGSTNFCSVASDTEMGGYLAARHLIEQGRRKLLCVGGPRHQVQDRIDGANRALLEFDNVSMEYMGTTDLTLTEGERVAERISDMPEADRPDGIFAFNDLLAIGILNRLSRLKEIDIPKDLSLVGHDDIEFASIAPIPLTTIRQPVKKIAVAAVRLALLESEEGTSHTHKQETFVPELIVRHTSRPIRTSAP